MEKTKEEKAKDYRKAYYKKNKKKMVAAAIAWQKKNPKLASAGVNHSPAIHGREPEKYQLSEL